MGKGKDLFGVMADVFGTRRPRARTKTTAADPPMKKRAKTVAKPATTKAKPTAKALRAGLDKSVTRASKEGEIRRDEAMDRAESHASPEWLREAYETVRRVASRKPYFTSADIWEAGLSMPHEPRALGPVMSSCERDGIICATREYRATNRPSRHAAPVRVWKSLLCGQQVAS